MQSIPTHSHYILCVIAQLEKLEVQKVDAVKRLETNHKWAEKFDKEIGPFEKTYVVERCDAKCQAHTHLCKCGSSPSPTATRT